MIYLEVSASMCFQKMCVCVCCVLCVFDSPKTLEFPVIRSSLLIFNIDTHTHMIPWDWYIYLHEWLICYDTCRLIFHTWILRDINITALPPSR